MFLWRDVCCHYYVIFPLFVHQHTFLMAQRPSTDHDESFLWIDQFPRSLLSGILELVPAVPELSCQLDCKTPEDLSNPLQSLIASSATQTRLPKPQ